MRVWCMCDACVMHVLVEVVVVMCCTDFCRPRSSLVLAVPLFCCHMSRYFAEAVRALKGELAVRGVLDARSCISLPNCKLTGPQGALFFGVALPAVHAMLETLPRAVEATIVPRGTCCSLMSCCCCCCCCCCCLC